MKLPALRKALKTNAIKMMELDSSVIRQVGYERDERCLVVQFVNGTRYAYHNVPPKVYQSMLQAWSPGHEFADHIRDKFVYTKL